MYDGMRATNEGAALYFLFIVIVGNYVVLNLFLAILLEQFSCRDTAEQQGTLQQEPASLAGHERTIAASESAFSDTTEEKPAENSSQRFRPLHEAVMDRAGRDAHPRRVSLSRIFSQEDLDMRTISSMLEGRSLFFFGPSHPVRCYLAWIVWHRRFEQLILALIGLSSIILAMDAPKLDPNSRLHSTLVRPLMYHNTFKLISCLLLVQVECCPTSTSSDQHVM
jgi:hypothetical protein